MNRRVVLDTSVLVSAALRIGSIPHRALQKALAAYDLCASSETHAELERVLERVKFELYLDRDSRQEFTLLIGQHSHFYAVAPSELPALYPACRDSEDNKFLALAQVAKADTLVTSDEDLLILHPWNGVAILTPSDFLSSHSVDRLAEGG